MTKIEKTGTNTVATTKKRYLPRNTERAVQEIIGIVNDLTICLTEENNALDNADVPRFMALQDRKIEITHRYNDGVQQLLARKDELKTLSPEKKQELLKTRESFSALTRDNFEHIERMRSSVERLNGHIMTSARKHADKKGVNYSNHGHIQKESRGLSMGLNESA